MRWTLNLFHISKSKSFPLPSIILVKQNQSDKRISHESKGKIKVNFADFTNRSRKSSLLKMRSENQGHRSTTASSPLHAPLTLLMRARGIVSVVNQRRVYRGRLPLIVSYCVGTIRQVWAKWQQDYKSTSTWNGLCVSYRPIGIQKLVGKDV